VYRILLIAAGTLVLAVTGLACSAIVRKAVRQFRLRRRLELESAVRGRLLELVAEEGDPPARPLTRSAARCETRVAWELLRKLRGDARVPLSELLDQRGELARARRRTRTRGGVGRARAASLLGDAADGAALPDLVKLLSDRDPEVRRIAVRSLGQLGAPEAVPDLLATLHGGHACSPTVIAEALMEIGAVAHPELRIGLGSPEPAQREIAALVLGLTGALDATDDLTGLLAYDPDAAVRRRAGEALGRLGLPAAVPALSETLAVAATGAEREVAARALARIGDPRASPALARALDDPEPDVAVQAALGLALLDERDLLAARADSPHAREALERLGQREARAA